jgi:Ankyrin repeats (3 copies)
MDTMLSSMLHALSTNPALMSGALAAFESLGKAEAAVATGADIYSEVPRDLEPHTLAIHAVMSDYNHILTALIEKHGVSADYVIPNLPPAGPWLQGPSSVGVTSLLYVAAGKGSLKCVQVLISHGATVNAVPAGCDGTALSTAAAAGNTSICTLLLDAGADIELALRESLFTPLSLAAKNGHLDTVNLLVERGANVNVGDWKQRTPIMLACDNHHVEVVKALMPRADLMHCNSIGCMLLHHASAFGPAFINVVLPRYLEAGLIDVQTQDTGGRTIEGATTLIFLCRAAMYTEAKLLLQAGASRYVKDSKMRSAVNHAVVGNSLACLHCNCSWEQLQICTTHRHS